MIIIDLSRAVISRVDDLKKVKLKVEPNSCRKLKTTILKLLVATLPEYPAGPLSCPTISTCKAMKTNFLLFGFDFFAIQMHSNNLVWSGSEVNFQRGWTLCSFVLSDFKHEF